MTDKVEVELAIGRMIEQGHYPVAMVTFDHVRLMTQRLSMSDAECLQLLDTLYLEDVEALALAVCDAIIARADKDLDDASEVNSHS